MQMFSNVSNFQNNKQNNYVKVKLTNGNELNNHFNILVKYISQDKGYKTNKKYHKIKKQFVYYKANQGMVLFSLIMMMTLGQR